MKSDYSNLDLLEALERELSDALSTVSLMKRTREYAPEIEVEHLGYNKRIYALFINGRGRKASESEVRAMNPKDYVLYLDVTTGTLSFRTADQQTRTQTVQEAGISGVEDILGEMIASPNLNFGNANIGLFLPHRAKMTPDAFRKAMAKIRNAIQNGDERGPLLLRFERSHYSVSESGYAWRISKDLGDLCFIKFLPLPPRFRQ